MGTAEPDTPVAHYACSGIRHRRYRASRNIGGDARFALVMNADSLNMNDKYGWTVARAVEGIVAVMVAPLVPC